MQMKRLKLLKILKPKRMLSKREKFLLIVLSTIIACMLVFRLVIRPQYDRLQNLIEKRDKYAKKISNMDSLLNREDGVYREWNDLHRQKSTILGKYFSNIEQPQIIYIMDGLLGKKMEISDIRFDRPQEEQIGESKVKVMNISIPYKSTYKNILDTVKRISANEKRIFISDLTMDGNDDGSISGDLKLKVYCLEGIVETAKEVVDVDVISNGGKLSPFEIFDGYIKLDDEPMDDDTSREGDAGGDQNSSYMLDYRNRDVPKDGLDGYDSRILEDFEDNGFKFGASHDDVEGNLSRATNSKSGKYSIKLEYNIHTSKRTNRAYIDLGKRNIVIESVPYTLGIWVYSYRYSPVALGFQFKGQGGENLEVNLTKNISWRGWRYLKAIPPQDWGVYPLKLEKIFLELPNGKDEYGIILFDKLEGNYPKGDRVHGGNFDF